MENQNYSLVAIVIGVLVLIVGAAVWFSGAEARKYSAMSTREMAFLCITHANLALHIHPHLEIQINGQKQGIPANIGITDICMHTLHTHDDTGTIHIEGPVARDFTLGDFFAIWEKPFSKTELFDLKTDGMHEITVTLNGERVSTFEDTVIKDGDQVVVSYHEFEVFID